MPVLPLVIPERDFKIAFETPSTSLPLENLANFAYEPANGQMLFPSEEDIRELNARLTIKDGEIISSRDLAGVQDENRAGIILDHLIAKVVNIAKPLAQLQAFVERVLRAAPQTDITAHGLKQLAEAREVIDESGVLDKLLKPLNNGQIELNKDSELLYILDPDGTGFSQNSRAYRLLGETKLLIHELQHTMRLFNTKLQTFADLKDRFKVQVIVDQPGQYSFVDEAIAKTGKTVSANQVEWFNAIFNKAGLGDLIRLVA